MYAVFHRASNSLAGPLDRAAALVAMEEGLEVFELVQVEDGQIEDEIEYEEAESPS